MTEKKVPRRYTEAEIEFLKEYTPGHSYREITEEHNRRFPDLPRKVESVRNVCVNHKIHCGGHQGRPVYQDPAFYTEDELAFLKEYAPGHSRKEIHEEYNRRFPERPRSFKSVVACMKNHDITNGRDTRFPPGGKGSRPWNQGKKMSPEQYEKCKATMFSKNHRPVQYLPIGTEKKLSDGYIWVKVDDQICAKKNVNWKQKQRLIWEEANGPIPDGMFVTFLDGNRENFNLDNLALITRAEHARLNQSGLRSEDPEITAAALQVAKLTTKIGQLQRENKKTDAEGGKICR